MIGCSKDIQSTFTSVRIQEWIKRMLRTTILAIGLSLFSCFVDMRVEDQHPHRSTGPQQLISESLFAFNHWDTLRPTSDGYPDVSTCHVLQFYLEATSRSQRSRQQIRITLNPKTDIGKFH